MRGWRFDKRVGRARIPRFPKGSILHFIAAGVGLFAGLTLWFAASHWLASSIFWAEARFPKLVGSKSLRVYEAIICGLLVLGCFAVAFWIMEMIAG
jgi:hypothetical protein